MYAGMGQDDWEASEDGTGGHFDTYSSQSAPVAMVEPTAGALPSENVTSDFLAALFPIANPVPASDASGTALQPTSAQLGATSAGGVTNTQALVILGILLFIVFSK
jgi:hypothetical protein